VGEFTDVEDNRTQRNSPQQAAQMIAAEKTTFQFSGLS